MENFDQLALTWDNEPGRVQRAKAVANEIIKAIPDLKALNGLEYGCGTGLLSFNLHMYFKNITLADNSQGMLDVVKQKIEKTEIKNMTPVFMDISNEAKNEMKFDIIYSLMALHHISELDNAIGSFWKMLRSPGYLCIADLDEEDGSFHGEGFTGHRGFNRDDLTGKLMKYGFSNISWKICYENIKRFEDKTERKYPLFLLIAEKKV